MPDTEREPGMSSFRIFAGRDTSIMVVSASARAERFAKVGDNAVMSASMKTDPDIELFREDLLALKRDVASLTEHVEGGATSTVQNAAGQIAPRVRSRSEKAVSLFIEKQPVAALSIAVAVGYIGARVLRR